MSACPRMRPSLPSTKEGPSQLTQLKLLSGTTYPKRWERPAVMSGNTVSSIVVPFLGAIQASISALLTVGVGVAAAQWGLLNNESSKHISGVCVKVFLPFLLIANLGEQLELDTVQLYVPILSKLPLPITSHCDTVVLRTNKLTMASLCNSLGLFIHTSLTGHRKGSHLHLQTSTMDHPSRGVQQLNLVASASATITQDLRYPILTCRRE